MQTDEQRQLVKRSNDPLMEQIGRHHEAVRALYVVEYRKFVLRTRGHDPEHYGRSSMPRWDGGIDPHNGRTYAPTWPRLSAWAFKHGLCPFDLIVGAFALWPDVGHPPFPNQLCSDRAVALCREWRESRLRVLAGTTRATFERLSARIAAALRPPVLPGQVGEILRASGAGSPLVRFVAACRCGHVGVMNEYWHRAAIDYLGRPDDWNKVLGDVLPDDLKEYAREYVLPALTSDL